MPAKSRKNGKSASATTRPRRSTRQMANSVAAEASSASIPDVYQDMLVEVAATEPVGHSLPVGRPAKRQKLSPALDNDRIDALFGSPEATSVATGSDKSGGSLFQHQQTAFEEFASSDGSDDESEDVEFEDVELADTGYPATTEEPATYRSIQVDLTKSAKEVPKRTSQRRKPLSKAERTLRLDVHKWHLLSLISHGLQRNAWCNAEQVHMVLKPLVARRMINLLHTDESKAQFERNYSFTKGVEEICAFWRQRWTTTVQGLRRPYWRDDADARSEVDEAEDVDFDDFKDAASTCRGSRDLGAQIFTALLRSIAVEARLVFSLQVLPFVGTAKTEAPLHQDAKSDYITAPAQNYGLSSPKPGTRSRSKPKAPKRIVDSQYPVFWTEILTPDQRWIPLDPIVRNTIAKPKTQFEPPLADRLNSMTYVVAYEDDNSARDVTRRYSQWFNAKTRKLRVESTKNGADWYTSVMARLHKRVLEPRDELEDDELARRTNSEGMPHNIQDFKNHPVYVLERHMRANEVLQPRREVGKINVGTAKNGRIEPVYRRQDVHLCRTADAWYRRGRDVGVGEQPLKRALPKSRRGGRLPSPGVSDDEHVEEAEGVVGLYAEYQTGLYEPPAVIDGRLPKNAYGNLDVYVPSMIPPGAVHVSHPLAASAAKTIGVDFADAVTGFDFKGRQGTAIVNGIIVAEQFTAAIASVITGLHVQGSEEIQQARSNVLLGIWKKMLQVLRVRGRVEAEYGGTVQYGNDGLREDEGSLDADDDSDFQDNETKTEAGGEGGGFMLEVDETEEKVQEQANNLQMLKSTMPVILPEELSSVAIKVTRSPHKLPSTVADNQNKDVYDISASDDGLFDDRDEGDLGADGNLASVNGYSANGQGGFMLDDDVGEASDGAGGFLPDDSVDGRKHVTNSDLPLTKNTPAKISPLEASSSKQNVKRVGSNRTQISSRLASSSAVGSDHERQSAAATGLPIVADPVSLTDQIHSDAEEDSALQIAIAESLGTAQRGRGSRDGESEISGSADRNQADDDGSFESRGDATTAASKVLGMAGHKTTETRDQHPLGETKSAESARSDHDGGGELAHEEPSSQSPSSLISHDPAEDDEEPEWLNEVLE